MTLIEDIEKHFIKLQSWLPQDVFVDRRFTTAERWNETSGAAGIRLRGAFRDYEPDLDLVLKRSRIVVLGEPGSGKSRIVQAVVARLVQRRDLFPVPALLKSYQGDLRSLLLTHTSAEILDAENNARFYL